MRSFSDGHADVGQSMTSNAEDSRRVCEAVGNGTNDTHSLQQVVRRIIGRWVNTSYRRRPMIVPVVIEA